MIRLGERQDLSIAKIVSFGVYLEDIRQPEEERQRVLLPAKEVSEDAQVGDSLNVFIYRDSKDRMIATTRQTEFSVGETAVLEVSQVGKIGVFLKWSLEKDLLLPFKEQTASVKPGDSCLVALYIDKSGRLCTTMKVYPYLRLDSPYGKDDRVEGIVYEVSQRFGTFVAVDDRYSALIPAAEPAEYRPGDRVSARVVKVLEDGKLTLSLKDKAYLQIEKDAVRVLEMIDQAGGRLPFSDKAAAEVIREKTGMSRNEFKRAVGSLYKQRLIVIEPDGIRKVSHE